MILDVLLDAVLDCLKDLPFLFIAFLILEALEHHTSEWMNRTLGKAGNFGPAVGALLGCVPQCGFSIMASDFYAGGVITMGTLLSVFLSTSDEAAVILMSNPSYIGDVGRLILMKIIIAVIAGYLIMFLEKAWKKRHPERKEKEIEDLCRNCGCEHEEGGILKPALHHTGEVLLFLFIFTFALNWLLEAVGMGNVSRILLSDSPFQPVLASLIGLIPNCAASVILTELYVEGVISFGSAVAGLCSAAGLGLIVLFRINRHRRENIMVVGLLLLVAICSGIILQGIL